MVEPVTKAGVYLWQYVSAVLIIAGTFGNILSILILSRPRFRKQASTALLLGLAVADLSMLYVGLLRQWVKYVFGTDIRELSGFTCKVQAWLVYVVADCTVWFLVAVTAERLVITLRPYSSARICTRNLATVSLVVVAASAAVVNCHVLAGYTIHEHTGIASNTTISKLECGPKSGGYEHFFDHIWSWIDLCKFSLVPFVLLSGGNICIVYKLIQNKNKVKNDVRIHTNEQPKTRTKQTSNMTVVLLSLNVVFIVSTLPISIYLIGVPIWLPRSTSGYQRVTDPWWAFVNLLMYTNNTCNFILYCLMGSRFRGEAKKLFQVCRKGVEMLPGAHRHGHRSSSHSQSVTDI